MLLKAVNRRSASKQLPLHLILIVPFILQIFAAVGLTGYLSIRNGQKAVNAVASELRNEISDRINQKILTHLEKPYIINQTVASAIAEGQINLNDIQGIEHFFWRLVNQNTADFLLVGASDGTSILVERLEEGYIVARTADKSNLPNRPSYRLDNQGRRVEVLKIQPFDPRTRPWYKAALQAGKAAWSEFFVGAVSTSKVTIALSEPIYSQTGKLLGVQSNNFRISNIHEFLKDVKVGHNGQTFIIDRSGNLIASSLLKQPYIIRDSQVEQISATKIENPIIHFTAKALFNRFGNLRVIADDQQLDFLLNGQRQFVQVSPIRDGRGIDWLSVVVVPESDFMAQINANTHTTILLCLAALGIATVLGIYTSQRIARPIMLLSQASEAIAEGAFHQSVEIYGIRELSILARSFNRMTQQLRESFTNLEQTNHQLEQRVEERTSELKNTLQNLQYAQAQIIQTEKMSSLGQLVAGVAHEINNPVNFIHGNVTHLYDYTHNLLDLIHLYQSEFPNSTSTIEDKIDDIDLEFLSEDMLKLLTSMKVGTERIREIVKSLRTFSRLDEAEVKQVDIHEGIESTLLILQHRLEAKGERPEIEVIRDYGKLPLVECYSGQLNQVFMNILINAIDAIEQAKAQQNGKQNKHKPSQITIHTSVMNLDWVEIAIADNGLGMPQEIQQRMFDPFFTTKPVGKGTGMGMSISYQIIIDKHHGKLNCFSNLGEGTKFVIQIPVRQEDHKIPLLLGGNLSNSKK